MNYYKTNEWTLKPTVKGDRENPDANAIYSIDGEKYPAQDVSGKVLKRVLPIYCFQNY